MLFNSSQNGDKKMSQENAFLAIRDFPKSTFNGRERNELFLGDAPDTRICEILLAVKVLQNHPSQWHSRFPNGYIRLFTADKRRIYFDRRGSVDGNPRYLFKTNDYVIEIAKQIALRSSIRRWAETATTADLGALLDLEGKCSWSKFLAAVPSMAQSSITRNSMIRELSALLRKVQITDGTERLRAIAAVTCDLQDRAVAA
jgi:hypothetical protein